MIRASTTKWAAALTMILAMMLAGSLLAGNGQRVKYVIDGDTLILANGRHVRLIGINAPEIAHLDRPGEPYGQAARRQLIELIGTGAVNIATDRSKTDAYGRLLAYVANADGQLLNEQMVLAGLAYSLPHPANARYTDRLLAAQRNAMAARRGFWQHLEPVAGPYIGNRRSMRFHTPSCPNGRHIGHRNRVALSSLKSAFENGYAPGHGCLPGISVIMGAHTR